MNPERKKSLLRPGSGAMPTPTPTPSSNSGAKIIPNINVNVDNKSANPSPAQTPMSNRNNASSRNINRSSSNNYDDNNNLGVALVLAEIPEALGTNDKDSKPSVRPLDLPDVLIEAHAPMPSISPRDKLSYVEDKKAWKEQKQYEETMAALNILIGEIESSVLMSKPDDIPAYIVDEFFSERNLIEIRKVIEQRSKFLL